MDMSGSGLMSLLAQKMAYLNQKQIVHAENVANSSTPGYHALELAPFSFQDTLNQTIGMKTDNPMHIIPASLAGVNKAAVKVKDYDKSIDGNDVDEEQEMMKVSQTGAEYQLVTQLYKKFTGFFKLALRGSESG